MTVRTGPPSWLVKVALGLLSFMITAWASYVTSQALEVRTIDTKVIQAEVKNKSDHEILNYKLDLLLKIHGIDIQQLEQKPK